MRELVSHHASSVHLRFSSSFSFRVFEPVAWHRMHWLEAMHTNDCDRRYHECHGSLHVWRNRSNTNISFRRFVAVIDVWSVCVGVGSAIQTKKNIHLFNALTLMPDFEAFLCRENYVPGVVRCQLQPRMRWAMDDVLRTVRIHI